jgi:hypothetical protein
MPNGIDKNFVRLGMACSAFRAKHGVWPTEARVAPPVLWDYGQLFDLENFERLCSRLRLRTTNRAHIAVGNANAHLVYGKIEGLDTSLTEEAFAWLGVRVRPELEHLE